MDRRLKNEQFALLYQSLLLSIVVSIFVTGTIFYVIGAGTPSAEMYAWCAAIILMTLIRAVPLLFFRFGSGALSQIENWSDWFFVTLIAQTIVFASAHWFIYPADPIRELFFIVLFVGIAAGGALVLAAHLPSATIFVVTLLLPLAFRFVTSDDFPFVFGLLTVVYGGLLINTARDHSHYIKRSFFLQKEKEQIIDDLRASERELLLSREIAEESSRAKSEFLANMSHELRTPLNAIIGFSEIMYKQRFGPMGSDKYQEYSSDINSAGNYLLELINDVLDLSKIEASQFQLNLEHLDINDAIEATVRMIRDRLVFKKMDLEVDLFKPAPTMIGDPRAVKQIILNLLTNAVKFTPEGGKVTVRSTKETDGCVAFQVADTGIGIDQADIPRVLEPFGQVSSSDTKAQEGTGLGLHLAGSLAALHDGTLELESELGIGTCVTVRFPSAAL